MGVKLKYAFKFVCQKGKWEAQAVLLAASLKRYLRCNFELVVAVPGKDRRIYADKNERYESPMEATIKTLRKLGVRIVEIDNDTGNPYNNPLYCLDIETSAEKSILMDSDILCMREFKHEPRFEQVSFNAKQAHKDRLGPWKGLFKVCDVEDPGVRIPTTVSKEYIPPYFNAGFIAIDTKFVKEYIRLAIDCHDRIKRSNELKGEFRHFIPQISLSIAMLRLKIPYEFLDDRYNFPMRYFSVVSNEQVVPYFCHYHTPADILKEPSGAVRNLIQSLAKEHDSILEVLRHFPEYFELL